jgi:hypothetical protein
MAAGKTWLKGVFQLKIVVILGYIILGIKVVANLNPTTSKFVIFFKS